MALEKMRRRRSAFLIRAGNEKSTTIQNVSEKKVYINQEDGEGSGVPARPPDPRSIFYK